MGKSYIPDNPLVDDFTGMLKSGVQKATLYGKYLGKLAKGKTVRYKIPDNSMKPYLNKGDVVIIKHATVSNIGVGDIVFYRKGDELVIRRVIRKIEKVGETIIFTKAESSKKAEPPVKPSQIIGKVVKAERWGKEISLPPANFYQKITAYGTIPLYKVVFNTIAGIIPFVHPEDELLDEWGRRKTTNKK